MLCLVERKVKSCLTPIDSSPTQVFLLLRDNGVTQFPHLAFHCSLRIQDSVTYGFFVCVFLLKHFQFFCSPFILD